MKMGTANDYRTPDLQLAKEGSRLITSSNVRPAVLQAHRYFMLQWESSLVYEWYCIHE